MRPLPAPFRPTRRAMQPMEKSGSNEGPVGRHGAGSRREQRKKGKHFYTNEESPKIRGAHAAIAGSVSQNSSRNGTLGYPVRTFSTEGSVGRIGAGIRRERPKKDFALGYTNEEAPFLGCARGRCRARSAQRRAPSRPFANRRPRKQELTETEPAAAASSVFLAIPGAGNFLHGRRIGHTARGPELGRRRGTADHPHVRTHARVSCG